MADIIFCPCPLELAADLQYTSWESCNDLRDQIKNKKHRHRHVNYETDVDNAIEATNISSAST